MSSPQQKHVCDWKCPSCSSRSNSDVSNGGEADIHRSQNTQDGSSVKSASEDSDVLRPVVRHDSVVSAHETGPLKPSAPRAGVVYMKKFDAQGNWTIEELWAAPQHRETVKVVLAALGQ
jgi:hypothetical protein